MKIDKSKLILGSAQWGMDYGVKNNWNQTSPSRVASILEYASNSGLKFLDTARSYGDSESLIGKYADNSFNIITKLLPLGIHIRSSSDLNDFLDLSFNSSLYSLRTKSLYGLLVHHCNDLYSSHGASIIEFFNKLKAEGLLIKFGVSIYSLDQLDFVLKSFNPDIVQLPLNILDRRMIRSGAIDRLQDLGIEVHARSIFLQGLLLMSPDKYPSYFKPWREDLEYWVSFCQTNNISRLSAALSYLVHYTSVDKIVVGVDSPRELADILSVDCPFIDFRDLDRSYSLELIDPSLWAI